MENQQNQASPIDFSQASLHLLMQNQAYLKTILENQATILAQATNVDRNQVVKESNELYDQFYGQIQVAIYAKYNTNK
jgi:hypothetical protein